MFRFTDFENVINKIGESVEQIFRDKECIR